MLTLRDRRTQAETGLIPPDRLAALEHALRALSLDAREAAGNADEPHLAAALRGKKLGYLEAARMVAHIREGCALHPRRFSSARRRNQEAAAR